MSFIKRIALLILFLDLPLTFVLFGLFWGKYDILIEYPMAVVVGTLYTSKIVAMAFIVSWIILPILICAYLIKTPGYCKIMFSIGLVMFIFICFICFNEITYANNIKNNYNPETVQSTMVEIDLQQLEELQNNEQATMIYFGRPSCAHCSEIKPNLDILVNNSHSLVYYYNTEQDREDNHSEMQAVLDIYGVSAVPALVVWANAGETQEVYFNEEIVDYFLDTNRFSY